MKKIIRPKPRFPQFFTSALLIIAAVMIVVLIIGTIIGLVRPANARPVVRFGKPGKTEQTGQGNEFLGDMRVFSGLGRLRIPLSNSSILILSIAFPYSASDVTFTEELAGKISEFRVIATDYFSSLPPEKLTHIDEEAAKIEILRRYNAILRLGRIESLYFSDMMTLDN